MQQRERVHERVPEREQRLHNYSFQEERAIRYENLRELFRTAPRVIKYDSVPWEQVPQAYHKILTGSNLPEAARKLKHAPIHLLRTRVQIIDTVARTESTAITRRPSSSSWRVRAMRCTTTCAGTGRLATSCSCRRTAFTSTFAMTARRDVFLGQGRQ